MFVEHPRAADLADGSVVADHRRAYIKTHPTSTAAWRGTDGGYHHDWTVDEALTNGAEVLRDGTGEEVEI
jgi:hypothetical protein